MIKSIIVSFPENLRSLYWERTREASFAFSDITHKALHGDLAPIGINGYTPFQEKILAAAIAICNCPEILRESQCAHRAVVACTALYFEDLPGELVSLINQHHQGAYVMLRENSKSNRRVFMSYEVNNWQKSFNPNYNMGNPLNCKTIPGTPNDVPLESLTHLGQREMKGSEDFDNACPKRTMGLECRIRHAERSIIEMTVDTFRNLQTLGVPPATKTILTTTWVSCPDCFDLISQQQEIYGNNIDLFSVYAAAGDQEDIEMAESVRRKLDINKQGQLLGPYISVPKNPGYGWYPARRNTAEEVKRYISKKSPVDFRTKRLLINAFSLLKD